jgi:hypothetical protein
MQRASSVERLWLAMTVAQLWCISLGCQAEARLEEQFQQHEPGASLPAQHIARQRRKRPVGQLPPRRLSCVVRGRLELLAMLFQVGTFPMGILRAEVWPEAMTTPQKQTPSVLSKKKTQKEKERRKRQKRRARARVQN